MSDRLTDVGPRQGVLGPDGKQLRAGIADYGRRTRAEMIEQYRRHYQRKLDDAQAALAVPDEDLEVVTYLGLYARRKLEVVTE